MKFKKIFSGILTAGIVVLPISAQAALSPQTVWEVRANGNNTNGGAFVAGASGTDYSIQDAKNTVGSNISTTDAVANGTTTITSATANFTSAIVGNVIYLAGGTGSLEAGRYRVTTFTNSTTIVVDRNVASGTGITMNIGGAVSSLTEVNSHMVSRNKIFMKADAEYTISSGITMSVAGGITHNQMYNQLEGYSSTRGDGGRPTIRATTSSINMLTLSGAAWRVANLILDCDAQTSCTGVTANGASTIYQNIKVMDYTTYGFNTFSGNPGKIMFFYNEVTGGASGSTGIRAQGNGYFIFNNYVHDISGTGISTTDTSTIMNNIVDTVAGASSDCINAAGNGIIMVGNTTYNCGRHGISLTQGINTHLLVRGNIMSNTGGCGLSYTPGAGTPATPWMDGNGYWSNTGGARCNLDDTGTVNAVNSKGAYTNTLDVVFTGTPFVDAANADFSLNTAGGAGASARSTGTPRSWPGYSGSNYLDMGAVQYNTPANVKSSFVFGE